MTVAVSTARSASTVSPVGATSLESSTIGSCTSCSFTTVRPARSPSRIAGTESPSAWTIVVGSEIADWVKLRPTPAR